MFEKSWRLGDIPEDWKKANVTPIYKNGLKEDPGNYRPMSSITSVPGKVMERIPLRAITSQMKHVIGKSQHGFTKGKLCLTNPIAFYDKVIFSVDVGQVVDIVYLGFSKASNTVPHSLLLKASVNMGSLGYWNQIIVIMNMCLEEITNMNPENLCLKKNLLCPGSLLYIHL
ncbi:mitochondrial enolase superfamily member 1 [Grus japonensis]|uniref:Mitochondrial enolase superfamily member 1 n=1 Tax=Grus japonensis TaxID=30415 RepID=A0ABC9X070_GRUJA